MLDFIMNNGGTIAVGLTVLAVLIRIAVGIVKEKKEGKSCCGSCSGCPGSCACHKQQERRDVI